MKLSQFRFKLPEDRIALEPPQMKTVPWRKCIIATSAA